MERYYYTVSYKHPRRGRLINISGSFYAKDMTPGSFGVCDPSIHASKMAKNYAVNSDIVRRGYLEYGITVKQYPAKPEGAVV